MKNRAILLLHLTAYYLRTCLGLVGSVLLVRLITKLLFGTAPLDLLTFAAVPVLLAAVALAASYIPRTTGHADRSDCGLAMRVMKLRIVCKKMPKENG